MIVIKSYYQILSLYHLGKVVFKYNLYLGILIGIPTYLKFTHYEHSCGKMLLFYYFNQKNSTYIIIIRADTLLF